MREEPISKKKTTIKPVQTKTGDVVAHLILYYRASNGISKDKLHVLLSAVTDRWNGRGTGFVHCVAPRGYTRTSTRV